MAEDANKDNPGYRDIPVEDQKKAQVFFGHGKTKADTGAYEYSIDMYLSGLNLDPDAVPASVKLRDISLKPQSIRRKRPGHVRQDEIQKAQPR